MSMDASHKAYANTLNIRHFQPDKEPWHRLGQYLYRIIENGSTTQYRLSVIESALPPQSFGPVFHFHEMHDEGFYVTKGKVRFHSPGRGYIDAKAGDMVFIPIRLPHRFSNPFDEEAVFINTITPGFFVRYFEHLEELIGTGKVLTPEDNRAALLRFATIPIDDATVAQLEAESRANMDEEIAKKRIIANGHVANGISHEEHLQNGVNGNGVVSNGQLTNGHSDNHATTNGINGH